MTVVAATPKVLLFGGYTEPWLDSIDRIHEQAGACSWLRQFLDDVGSVIRAETRCMHPKIRTSLGPSGIFSSVQEVADLYRDHDDDVGFVQCVMSYIVRAVILLRWVHDSPDVLKTSPRPEGLGISGGLINAAVLGVSHDFESLRQASVVMAGFVCRLCEVAGQVSRAVEDGNTGDGTPPSSWGCAVVGITPDELDETLDRIQESMKIPRLKRARVGIRGDHWGTVVGPPSVLDACLGDAAMGDVARQRLPIYSMQHNYELSRSHREYIAGRSALHSKAVHPGFRIWGLRAEDGGALPSYTDWGHLLLSVVDYAFSRPVDLVDMVKRLSTRLGGGADVKNAADSSQVVELLVMGPTWFAGSLTSKLKATGRKVSAIQHDVLGREGQKQAQPSGHPGGGGGADNYEGRIAVVGVAGMAPECSNDLEEYWNLIEAGRDVAREIPAGRFLDTETLFQPKQSPKCVSTCKLGCFLDKPGHYDSRFFRVSPREALIMDPGSRLFQMSCHEALESAGYSCGTTRHVDPGRIAVLFGQSNVDGYETAHHEKGCDAYTLQALARPFAGGRVAFHYGWEGATYSVDQACSTSLSLIHLACRGLLAGDHDMAVAGAANVLASPHGWCLLSKAGVLSDAGNCRTFRDDAQGYCRGEFVGVVVLKRLADAVAHNDRVLAVIPGSARNQAGNSGFLTQSDAGAEERVLRQALRSARLGAGDIAYAEMHGTATPVGDPCEMTAVSNVLGRKRRSRGGGGGHDDDDEEVEPLTVGSVKANIGHSEASSGVASVIKSILMFQKETLPPQAGAVTPSTLNKSFPPLDDYKIRILNEAVPFRAAGGKRRRVLINNFDAAGGNTAVVLEDFEQPEKNKLEASDAGRDGDPRPAHVVVLSAHTAASHQAGKAKLARWLAANPSARIEDVAYTTTARRVHQPAFRFACAASSTVDLVRALESDSKPATTKKSPVVFVFTGQGSHYAGMGAELYHTNQVFRETVDLCGQICSEFGFPPFVDIIVGPGAHIGNRTRSGAGSGTNTESGSSAGAGAGVPIGNTASGAWNTAQTQLAVLTLEIALAAFWQRLGVEPAMVVGHSLGEYAALHVAGVLSLADALYLVGSRAALAMQKCGRSTDVCAMLAVAAPADDVRALVGETLGPDAEKQCSVACVNSPGASVVSGTVAAVAQLQGALMRRKTRSKVLPLPFGFHSFQVDAIVDDFVALASGRGVSFAWPPRVPVASTLLGSVVDGSSGSSGQPGFRFGPEYLARQARNPVDFVGALHAVRATRFQDGGGAAGSDPVWLEIGPSRVCGAFVQETLSPAPGRVVSTLVGPRTSPWASIADCLASLYVNGCDPDWLLLHAPFERKLRLLSLPSYSWDTKDYWISYRERKPVEESAGSDGTVTARQQQQPMISTCAQYVVDKSKGEDGKTRVTLGASIADPGLLAMIEGHRMQGVGLCPGSVFCESALVAAKCAFEHASGRTLDDEGSFKFSLRDAQLRRPLTATLAGPDGELQTSAVVEPHGVVHITFKAVSRPSSSAAAAAAARSFDLGRCVVVVRTNADPPAAPDSDSFYIRARMRDVQRSSSNRLQAGVLYALFSRAVQYASDGYRCIREASVSDDFSEAVAEVVPARDPAGVRFVAASPYCGEALAHLAGFLVNCDPSRFESGSSSAAAEDSSFIMDSLGRMEQMADVVPGRSYFTYARVVERKAGAVVCEVVVFDDKDRLVMRTWGMRFHEAPNSMLRSLLPGSGGQEDRLVKGASSVVMQAHHPLAVVADVTETKVVRAMPEHQPAAPFSQEREHVEDTSQQQSPPRGNSRAEAGLLPVILESIAEETGVEATELTADEDAALADLGVDSIMAVEICTRVREKSGHPLSPLFMLEYPTIGHLIRSFGGTAQQAEEQGRHEKKQDEQKQDEQKQDEQKQDEQEQDEQKQDEQELNAAKDNTTSTASSSVELANSITPSNTPPAAQRTPEESSSSSVAGDDPVTSDDQGPLPKPRITLLQGRPRPDKGRLYMVCDGTGTIATYIHLLRRQYPLPVYGIDSPFLRCPARMTPRVGIVGTTKLMVDALLESHPDAGLSDADRDAIVIGGFSGGALFCYEMCRQLRAKGRRVAGLVVLDMRCPIAAPPPGAKHPYDEDAWPILLTTSEDHVIGNNASAGGAIEHLGAMFRCVVDYHPPRGEVLAVPAAVVWCTRGMAGRLRRRGPRLVDELVALGYPLESYPGYMEETKLGAVAWSVPDKRTEADLGPGGWDGYVGAGEGGEPGKNMLCLAVDGDHHDAIGPILAPKFAECLEKGVRFVLEKKRR
ncbi:Non-reducing polyketide synthase hmp3 [Colletotrichum sidae]|uniref:Non-reducing polyketide synthase hmp3 n=1 Tax=Colletotrichum sidae TaxID=1347389 RepID=A0A4V3I3R5_9PEZI|nr:Non-reducing polyketide synthase hmp3 [Colletotrichum sidae]